MAKEPAEAVKDRWLDAALRSVLVSTAGLPLSKEVCEKIDEAENKDEFVAAVLEGSLEMNAYLLRRLGSVERTLESMRFELRQLRKEN
jgi:hypothetical protein